MVRKRSQVRFLSGAPFTSPGPLVKRFNTAAFHAVIQGFESPTGHHDGGLAQLGEHLPYKQRVGGSIPSASTTYIDAGWSSSVARRAHNPKVAGSNPAPATNHLPELRRLVFFDQVKSVVLVECNFNSHLYYVEYSSPFR